VLFCPFCGESFEATDRCPDHDLPLVPWSALPKPASTRDDDEPLARWSPRLGRGAAAVASLLTLLAFALLPLGGVRGELALGGSMLALAGAGGHRLWLVPAAAVATWITVWRRRTPRSLRAARVAVAVLALVPPLAALWAFDGSRAAVRVLAERSGRSLVLEPGLGLFALGACALLALYAAVVLGRPIARSTAGASRGDR
jgi:hypothetical protein